MLKTKNKFKNIFLKEKFIKINLIQFKLYTFAYVLIYY